MSTIVRSPARIRSGQVSHEPVVTHDWTATLLEIAGAEPHPDYPLDGASFAGYLLRGAAAPERDLFWRTRTARALRRGRYKCLRATAAVADALYDVVTDPREQANLAANRPDIPSEKLIRLRRLMNRAVPDVLVDGYEPLIEALKMPDPGDRHVLAAAIKCRAQLIVTSNVKDFPVHLGQRWA